MLRADDVVRSFSLTAEEASNYTVVKEKLIAYFNARRNVIYERAKFNSRVQHSGEPIDNFLTSLYSLAQSCSFGQLKEELIRDRVVVVILDKPLSERLQLDPTLTLARVVELVRNTEIMKKQQETLHSLHHGNFDVEAVQRRRVAQQTRARHCQDNRDRAKCSWCGSRRQQLRHEYPA